MKKFLLAVFGTVMLLVVTSAYYPTTGEHVGDNAPNFIVGNGSASLELQALKGQYVLLSLWSSTDPVSRISNKTYNDLFASGESNIEFVSINFDPSEEVFNEIVKIDDLDTAKQFHASSDEQSVIWKDYDLHIGYKSLLISPDGEVIAQNPTAEDVKNVGKSLN